MPDTMLVPAGRRHASGAHFWVWPGRERKGFEPLENIKAIFMKVNPSEEDLERGAESWQRNMGKRMGTDSRQRNF